MKADYLVITVPNGDGLIVWLWEGHLREQQIVKELPLPEGEGYVTVEMRDIAEPKRHNEKTNPA